MVLHNKFEKAIYTNNPSDVEPSSLERSLMLAYEAAYFVRHNFIDLFDHGKIAIRYLKFSGAT
jgi:hypothetical protein